MPSSLLPNLQKYLRDRPSSDRRMSRATAPEEQRGFDQVIKPSNKIPKAELLESEMKAHDVGQCAIADNQFSHFLDGIQRSWLLYHHRYVPVYYGYVAGVIRERKQAVMSTSSHQVKEALYLPFRYFDPDEREKLKSTNLDIIDTEAIDEGDSLSQDQADEDPQATMQPMLLRGVAVEAVTNQRANLEKELTKEWLRNKAKHPGWLVMDGSIKISKNAIAEPRAVGIIKSHNTQFFNLEDQATIFELKAGQRSSTFNPYPDNPKQSLCSWYLRLREANNEDMYFGLVRVEVSLKHQNRVNEISQWIMTERRPLSLPDSRWDRMIYPIRDCEQYLRSKEPSKASFGWLG
ncbi:hypothetical protein Pse7367_2896 [Thalassoporum mexicanum PCC 7367]|uniref:hypothetical protein n=1 Tax=Thalassoporum mexicanum TaxID=3457544 RepID=UPI00029F8E30|nr:hypothetical protein [Pseudanabaena sp. PCC 7367]AFY71149.1 hypothetical protein Pse7367_2896 [Pseudanabaena sp. PCC 7367]